MAPYRRQRYLRFTETDTPSPDGATMVVNRFGCVSMVVRKSPISLFLFSTLCATNSPRPASAGKPCRRNAGSRASTRPGRRSRTVPGCPGIALKASPGNDLTMSERPGLGDVGLRLLGTLRVVFDGDQPAAGLAQAQADPDGAVAAGRADLERPLAAAGRHQQAQETAVFFGYRQLAPVGLPDVREQRRDGGGDPLQALVGRLSGRRLWQP